MAKILMEYGTTEGQMANIADYIADVIHSQGHEVDTAELKRRRDQIQMATTA